MTGTSKLENLDKAKTRSPIWNFFFQPPVGVYESEDQDEKTLGYVETGEETIQLLVECIRDGRHVMLVGPRGTGKSYMGAQAVRKAIRGNNMGIVHVIEIQGDPNKPPSDYFDDTISFTKIKDRLSPNMIIAPFFDLAQRKEDSNKFICHDDDNRIILKKSGTDQEIDRIVLYWDEGNRSSPAMLNAVLGLLAEGRLRRDGVAYTFPPISCILTRNPDGYDANSAKMPSPLIDRFGLQFYVYNPTMYTFVAVIAPEFLRRQRLSLLRELVTSFTRHQSLSEPDKDALKKLMEKAVAGQFQDDTQFVQEIKVLVKRLVGALNVTLNIPNMPEKQKEELQHVHETLQRVDRVPAVSREYYCIAARLATVVLATWGDRRDIEEKPGMQYLPPRAKEILNALAKEDRSVGAHLEEVGNLTRYGTSIRAFEEMLKGLLAPILVSDNLSYMDGLEAVRKNLGALLGHRCETTFNPDREPSKARRKTKSLHWLAQWILKDTNKDKILNLARSDITLKNTGLLDN